MNHEEKKINAVLSNRLQWALAESHGSFDLSFKMS